MLNVKVHCAGYRVDLSIVTANVQRADVRRIRIVTVRANDNGLPFSDITGESHSRRRSLKKKKKPSRCILPRVSRDFALNHRYLPSQTLGFSLLDRFYCVSYMQHSNPSAPYSTDSRKLIANLLDVLITFNNYLHHYYLYKLL